MERSSAGRRGKSPAPNQRSSDLRPPELGIVSYREQRERRRARAQDDRIREEAERNAYQARRRSLEEDTPYVPLDDNMSDIAEERSHGGKFSGSSVSPSTSPLVPSPLSVADLTERITTMGPAGGLAIESSRYEATREGTNSARIRRMPRSPFAGPSYAHERPTSSPEHPGSRVSSRPQVKNRSRFTGVAERESDVAKKTAAHIAGGQVRQREPVVRTPEPAPIPDAALAQLAQKPKPQPKPQPAAAAAAVAAQPSAQPVTVTSPRRLSMFRRKSQENLQPGEGASKAITGILKLPSFRRSRSSGGEAARSAAESSKSSGETAPRPTTRHPSFRGVRFGFLTSNRQPGDSSSSSSGWSRQTQPASRARSGASIPATSQQSRSSSGSIASPTTSPGDEGYAERQEQIIHDYAERKRQSSSELQRAASLEINRVKAAALEERTVEMSRNVERSEQVKAVKAAEEHVSQARHIQRQVEAERKAKDSAEAPQRQKKRDEERARVHRGRMVAELERRQLQREEDWARERERERERIRVQEEKARVEAEAEEAKVEELRRFRKERERVRRDRGAGKAR